MGSDDLVDIPPHPGIDLHPRSGEQSFEGVGYGATNQDIDSQARNKSRPLRDARIGNIHHRSGHFLPVDRLGNNQAKSRVHDG